jgi:aryl-alcohol dehydrogenase-like predicted oxidoreductase
MIHKEITTGIFGNTGRNVTRVGLGGEGILRTHGRSEDAEILIQTAMDEGITYFDSARVYADSEIYYGGIWQNHPEKRAKIFQASKSASRDKKGALADLEQTLARMGTDFLDLWQIHDVRTEEDLRAVSSPGGSLEGFLEAKASGKVRFIGVTGHHDPRILTRAVESWPVDSVMMPVNPVEEVLGGFLTSTLPAAKAKGIAVIGMKILGASHYVLLKFGITAELLIRYALSQDITVAIVGCSTPDEVRTLAKIGREPLPLSRDETSRLMAVFETYATRLAFYRGII